MSTLHSLRSVRSPSRGSDLSRHLLLTTVSLTALALSIDVCAKTASLEWDPVDDTRVAFYEVYWGTQSGEYEASRETTSTRATIDDLAAGETYYFAARACAEGGTTCSDFSEEIATTIAYAQPVAGFSESKTGGEAPLTVTFDDASQGAIDSYDWDFGDGNGSTAATAVHTYQRAGTYTVSLTVTGPAGTITKTKTDLITVTDPENEDPGNDPGDDPGDGDDPPGDGHDPLDPGTDPGLAIEAGEITVDHEWTRVEFDRSFVDPVVVTTSVSDNGGQPVTVRIDAIDQSGFSMRLQEWGYLDGTHAAEQVGYLVVERGSHQLPNGTWLEADEIPVATGEFWEYGGFLAPFETSPVVLSSVATHDDPTAVTTRLRKVESTGFEVMLQSAENQAVAHASELVAYVALEASCSEIDGLQFVAGKTANAVTDRPTRIAFANRCADRSRQFSASPVLLADMQTFDGPDPANVRWTNKRRRSAHVWVDEEQSRDRETRHTSEVVG